ncbi:MAG: hypothetical protein WBO04_16385 [Steroidobacteraceae bacterium]
MTDKDKDQRTLALDAIADVRDCAVQMRATSENLQKELPRIRVDENLRAAAKGLCGRLAQVSSDALSAVGEQRDAAVSADIDAARILTALSGIEGTMMDVLAGFAELVEKLEAAAERDERCEPAFVLVIEAAGGLLQRFQTAKASTDALRTAL